MGTDIASNTDMRSVQIRKYCALDDLCQNLMKTVMRHLRLTVRAYHRILKFTQTNADLAGLKEISQVSLAKVLQNRLKVESL